MEMAWRLYVGPHRECVVRLRGHTSLPSPHVAPAPTSRPRLSGRGASWRRCAFVRDLDLAEWAGLGMARGMGRKMGGARHRPHLG